MSDAGKQVYTLYDGDQTVEVPCVKIKDTWHDDSDSNFCYSSATGVGTAVLVGSLAVDVALEIASAGTLTYVAVGIGVVAVSYYATHSTTWPGHEAPFWNS